VELAFPSEPAFHTLLGKKFHKVMTLNRMGGTYSCIIDDSPLRQTRQTAIYKWLRNRPEGKHALHNIKLTFKPAGIWNIFSDLYADKVSPANKDVMLPTSNYFNYMDLIVTIHHTNTYCIGILCSFRSIAIDTKDMNQLFEALSTIDAIEKYRHSTAVEGMSLRHD
jgi:hypothetical protein